MWPISGCQAVKHAAMHDSAAADAGSDGQVEEIGKPLCGAPACFAERGRVHVGVKSYGKAEGSPYGPSKIEVRPGEFRGRGDVAVSK